MPSQGRDVHVFLCYRRSDGNWHAEWLNQHLNEKQYDDSDGTTCRIRIYYDKMAPGIPDWKKLHFPSLQTSQALILVSTPGIAKDLSKRGQSDWVYEELRWWNRNRRIAPILIDGTGEGDRWLPELITRKWPNINRIDLIREHAENAADSSDSAFADRICQRIIGAIKASGRATVFEDLERFKRLTKRLVFALAGALLLLVGAVVASYLAIEYSRQAEAQRAEAQLKTRTVISHSAATRSREVLHASPQRSLLLAIKSMQATTSHGQPPTQLANQALRDALWYASGYGLGYLGDATAMAFSSNGQWLAAGTKTGTIHLLDLSSKKKNGFQSRALGSVNNYANQM
jgi:hypothetical protein